MNFKRYVIATLAIFVFVFIYQWIVDSYILVQMYINTARTWRGFEEMLSNIPLTMCFMFVLSAWGTFVFSKIYSEGGIANGARFGLYFGVFAGILSASWYLWLPIPPGLALGWLVTRFLQVFISGLILGSLCRKS